jgi:trans-2,3-dihydro-3-hydroxyanthranilic acid synthase
MGIPRIRSYWMPTAGELPANTTRWTIEPHRAMLLVHDMQNYFLDMFEPGRPPVDELVTNAAKLRDRCAKRGIPVGYTAQPGGMSGADRGLLEDFWGPGMTADSGQRAITDELAPSAADRVFTKWRYSAFHRSDLLDFMRARQRDQLIICGVYAHIGCLMTACDAYSNDIQAFLVADAMADFTAEYHHLALRYGAERCSAVVSTAAVMGALTSERVSL